MRAVRFDGTTLRASFAAAAIAAVCGVLFAKAVVGLPRLLASWRSHRPLLCAFAAAALIVPLSLMSDHAIHGTGESEIARMVNGDFVSVAYPLVKAIATLLCFWIGLAGGLFGPSIAIGSGIGNALRDVFADVPAIVMVLSGMSAFLAAATRTPLTAAAFAIESSGQYFLAPLLVIAALLGQLASWLLSGDAIYSTPALRLLGATLPLE